MRRFWRSVFDFIGFSLFAAILPFAAVHAADADLSVIGRVGFSSDVSGPYLLMGTDYIDHQGGGHTWQMKVTNQVGPDAPVGTITLGLRSEWSRYSLFGMYSVGGSLSWSQRGTDTTHAFGLFGEGVVGRVQGVLVASYKEPRLATFAWEADDRDALIAGLTGGYQLDASVNAQLSPQLNWNQQLIWSKPLELDGSGLLLTTGPQWRLGAGRLSMGAGVMVRPQKMKSVGTLSYAFDPSGRHGWTFSSGTASLWRDQPFLEAGYRLATARWTFGSVLRLDYDQSGRSTPTVFFTFQPSA